MNKKMKWFVHNIPETISAITFAVMILVVAGNVFLRAIFSSSLTWTEEVAAICFIWCTFLGMTVCYKRMELISIDFFVKIMPKKIQEMMNYVLLVLLVVFNLVLFYYSLNFSIGAVNKLSQALRIPYIYIDSAIPISFGITSYYSVKYLIAAIRNHGKEVEETESPTVIKSM